MENRPKTIFLDIDGTILKHKGTQSRQIFEEPEILPDTLKKLHEWDRKGYCIILTTGRREEFREETVSQLRQCKIIYNQLVMGCTGGQRVVINDLKEGSTLYTASYVCPERNKGIGEIDI